MKKDGANWGGGNLAQHDGVTKAGTNKSALDPNAIGPNEPRPEDVVETSFALGQSTGYITPP